MAQVVPESYGLGEVFVQAEHARNGARCAGDQLYMQSAAAYVVIAHEAEHLGFSRVAVIGRHVQYFVDVAHEGGAVQPRRHIAAGVAAKSLRLACAIGVGAAFGAILLVALDEFFAEIAVCHGCFFRPAVRDGLVFGSRKWAAALVRGGADYRCKYKTRLSVAFHSFRWVLLQ
ncbi:MAG: hypothetical protein ACLRX5_00615 [Slackia sp.]